MGTFDHSQEQLIVPRFREGEAGAHVLTPFELSKNGDRILINRGWVPRNKQNASERLEGQITGEIPIEGLSRLSDPKKPSYFTPENEPAKRTWFWLDLPSMSKQMNTKQILLEVNDRPNPGGYPIGGQSVLSIRNQHLNYAVTWFSLTFFMCVSLYFFKKQSIGGNEIRKMVLGRKPR
jgi:surfeit locus 1 family protein